MVASSIPPATRGSASGRAYINDELARKAWAVLSANDRSGYTVPSPELFPFQWNWDSPLVAMALAHIDEERAFVEIETLLASQWESGLVPHIIYHVPSDGYFPGPEVWGTDRQPPTSGISQPPIAATCLRYIIEMSADRDAALKRAAPLVVNLLRWHRWWHEARDPEGTGLVSILHPWESGRDNSVDWDEPLNAFEPVVDVSKLRKDRLHVDAKQRPSDVYYDRVITLIQLARSVGWNDLAMVQSSLFRVCDVGVQSILVRADEDLMALLRLMGDQAGAKQVECWHSKSREAIDRLWDGEAGAYRAFDLRSGKFVPSTSATAFLPLYAGAVDETKAKAIKELCDRAFTLCTFAMPQVMPDTPGYDPDNYSRGPTWPYLNRIIADGLSRYGFRDSAERLRSDTQRLIARSGFREYYNPTSGEGLGGDQFAWTAAAWLIWAGFIEKDQ
ncbi:MULTISPECIES: trehalase family glycosidase [unclassified Mesorhizobium]|uniref:MGH1-like glycoside hydrolase domain-containing protein n=1 Tax=unclassified Mesorhizobium TaxID=325217 RepID=UPI003336FC21